MTEKMRCIAFACMNKQMKASFNDHFTRILLGDLHSWNRARDAAESAALARRLERDAAAGSLGSGALERAEAALSSALADLEAASRPPKFVTNWAYAPFGTEVLSRLVSGWTDADPSSITIPGLHDVQAATSAEHTAEIDARTEVGHRKQHQMTGNQHEKQHGQQPPRHCTV